MVKAPYEKGKKKPSREGEKGSKLKDLGKHRVGRTTIAATGEETSSTSEKEFVPKDRIRES